MSRVAKVLLALGIVFTIVCVGICLGTVWLFTPPQLEIPPRRYPPNNAYEPLRRIGTAITQRWQRDEKFKQLDQKVRTQHRALTPAERQAYVEAVRAELKAYPQYLNQPCAAIFDYNFNTRLPELVGFRTIANAEALLIEQKLAQGKDKEAVEHFKRAALLGIQIRNDGAPLHFFVGAELTRLALRPFFESPNMLDDPDALQQVIEFVKEWESRRPHPSVALEHERYFTRATLQGLADGSLSWQEFEKATSSDAAQDKGTVPSWFLRPFVRFAIPEMESWMDTLTAESRKPPWQRSEELPEPRNLLNVLLLMDGKGFFRREAVELTRMRLLGCVAAIRLHKQRTGRYPSQLSAPNLGEMAIDPFSGKSFVYRVDPLRGFLLYSVGVNRKDDGGKYELTLYTPLEGDILPVYSAPPRTPGNQRQLLPPVWLK